MASTNEPRLSVWDRLVDSSLVPDLAGVLPRNSVNDVRESIRAELIRLLNSRRSALARSESYGELDRSLVNYGIPDFTGANMRAGDDRESLRLEIERTIRLFEPRLSSVRVELLSPEQPSDRTVRLRIHAQLKVFDRTEPVAFESQLDAAKRRFDVKVSE